MTASAPQDPSDSAAVRVPRTPPGGDICLECGLCCNGGIFGRVRLTDEDRARLHAASVDTPPDELPQPCPFWGGSCSIYSARPGSCRQFRCKLLRGLDEGSIGFAEARSHVKTALAERARISGTIPDYHAGMLLLRDWEAVDPAKRSIQHSRVALDFLAYCSFIAQHFHEID